MAVVRDLPAAAAPATRRRWPWLAGLAALILVLAVWLTLPWLTCHWLQARTPLQAGAVIIRGAHLGGTPPQTMVIGVCDRATFLAIWRGSSGRWQPAGVLADGQHAWGTFTDAPEISWRLDLDDRISEPRISAAIPAGVAERLLSRELQEAHAQVGDVRLTTATLAGTPGAAGLTTWNLALAGSAAVVFNQQRMPVRLDRLQAQSATTLGAAATDGRPLTAATTISELAGEAPFIGQLTPWRGWLETRIRDQQAADLKTLRVPTWWPERVHWDLQITRPVLQEF